MKHPSLPTPEEVRREMRAEGWTLEYEAKEGRKHRIYDELWRFFLKGPREWAELDLYSPRPPRVSGNLDTILRGLAILNGEKEVQSDG